jgi:negative regulator of sigma E activity
VSHDRFRHYDAAYVLGALSAADRQEFEGHLRECEACRQAVSDVAGLPGLLARVDPAQLERADEAPHEPVPETLLPRLLREVSRQQRRRRTRATAMAAAAAAAVAAVSVGVTTAVQGDRPPSASAPVPAVPARAMTQVHQTALSARVAMEEVAWGTRLQVTCTYRSQRYGSSALPEYALVVRTRGGDEQQVATWRAVDGTPTTVTAATASRPSEIRSVEVRTSDGEPVLRLAS